MKLFLAIILGILAVAIRPAFSATENLRGNMSKLDAGVDVAFARDIMRKLAVDYQQYNGHFCYSKAACKACQKDGNGNGCGCNGGGSCPPKDTSHVCNKEYKTNPCEEDQGKLYTKYYGTKCYSKKACNTCRNDNNGNGCGCSGPSSSCGPQYSSYVCNTKYEDTPCDGHEDHHSCSKKTINQCTKLVKYRATGFTPGPDEATEECHVCCFRKMDPSCRQKCKKKCNWVYNYDF